MDRMAKLASEDFRAMMVHMAFKAAEATEEIQAALDKTAGVGAQDHRASRAVQVNRNLDHKASKDPRVMNPGHKDPWDGLENEDRKEKKALTVHKVDLDDVETSVARVQKANEAFKARKHQDHKECLAQLERSGTRALTGRLGHREVKVTLVHKGFKDKASKGCKVQLEDWDPRVRRALVHKAWKANEDVRAALDVAVQSDHRVAKAREHKVRLEKTACRAGRASMVRKVCKEKAYRVRSVHRALTEPKEYKEKACRVRSVHQENLESKACKAITDRKDGPAPRHEGLRAASRSLTACLRICSTTQTKLQSHGT